MFDQFAYDAIAALAMFRLSYLLCCDFLYPILERVNKKGQVNSRALNELHMNLIKFMGIFALVLTPSVFGLIITCKLMIGTLYGWI
jgi:hypothetical protein